MVLSVELITTDEKTMMILEMGLLDTADVDAVFIQEVLKIQFVALDSSGIPVYNVKWLLVTSSLTLFGN